MIKLIASDVDGTLLFSPDEKLSSEMIGYIKEIKRRNINFVVASGRQHANLVKVFDEVKTDTFFVCDNGGEIYKNDELLYRKSISSEIVEYLFDFLQKIEEVQLIYSCKDALYMDVNSPELEDEIKMLAGAKYVKVENLAEITEGISKISIFFPNKIKDEILQTVKSKCVDDLKIMVSGEKWLDICISNKGEAIAFIGDFLEISGENMLCFGDNENDISMFKICKNSFCMSHSSPNVRANAKYICENVKDTLGDFIKMEEFPEID